MLSLDFKPTHRHAQGGEYQLLAKPINVRLDNNVWVKWPLYRAVDNVLCTRSQESWDDRFVELTASQVGSPYDNMEMQLPQAARLTRLFVENWISGRKLYNDKRTNEGIGFTDPATHLAHILDRQLPMLEFSEIKGAKGHRWLGWAQAVLCCRGVGDLDAYKVINSLSKA